MGTEPVQLSLSLQSRASDWNPEAAALRMEPKLSEKDLRDPRLTPASISSQCTY